jgi:hypothetical protein
MCRQSRRRYRLCAGIFAIRYHVGTAMRINYSRIPRHTLKTLERWIATGRQLDDDNEDDAFCLAVLMNDLGAAVARADERNLQALPQIVAWLEHHAPRLSYGSPAALGAWPRVARVHAGSRV